MDNLEFQEATDLMNPFSNIREITSLSWGDFENACRKHTKYAYLGNYVGLCKILTKYSIYVDTRDGGVTPHFIMDGFWETWLTQCLAEVVKPGDVCIDIGANFGYYSLLMSELCGKRGKTIAIEPNPHICNLLRHSQSNHSFPFDIIEAAISNKSGKAVLTIPDAFPGSASIGQVHSIFGGHKTKVKVNSITVDELVEKMNLPKVDVIKIDVEGVEPLVFEGMERTINNNPGLKVIIEYSPFLYDSPRMFTEYLFSRFIVNRIKDVDQMQTVDDSAIGELIQLTDHTDLYLVKK